jgi:hypothetical protein
MAQHRPLRTLIWDTSYKHFIERSSSEGPGRRFFIEASTRLDGYQHEAHECLLLNWSWMPENRGSHRR